MYLSFIYNYYVKANIKSNIILLIIIIYNSLNYTTIVKSKKKIIISYNIMFLKKLLNVKLILKLKKTMINILVSELIIDFFVVHELAFAWEELKLLLHGLQVVPETLAEKNLHYV